MKNLHESDRQPIKTLNMRVCADLLSRHSINSEAGCLAVCLVSLSNTPTHPVGLRQLLPVITVCMLLDSSSPGAKIQKIIKQ